MPLQDYAGRQPLWEQWRRQKDPFLDARDSPSCNPSSRPWTFIPWFPVPNTLPQPNKESSHYIHQWLFGLPPPPKFLLPLL